METEKLINIWAVVAMLALILSAVGLFWFRYYSAKKNNERFDDIDIKISDEVEKAIFEINTTKDSIISKLTAETDSIVKGLRLNSKNANSALNDLQTESKKLLSDLKTDVSEVKKFTQNTLDQIQFPLGTVYSTEALKIRIKPYYIKEIDEKYKASKSYDNYVAVVSANNLKKTYDVVNQSFIPSTYRTQVIEPIVAISLTIVDNFDNDKAKMKTLIDLWFPTDNIGDFEIRYIPVLNKQPDFYDVVIGEETIHSSVENKSQNIFSRNEICSKFGLARIHYSPL